ncbi:hypothetical protein Nepgr_027292 [Nepenthes gracilis]|uniref:Uncharacterized protein n=1 Tax=Nepenthes gracilis TaxID=150966 RepID=A0AAD3TA29_NEPGR|nr:hypothetical protein Nepgr_027292 [Nepenthes gracilis]
MTPLGCLRLLFIPIISNLTRFLEDDSLFSFGQEDASQWHYYDVGNGVIDKDFHSLCDDSCKAALPGNKWILLGVILKEKVSKIVELEVKADHEKSSKELGDLWSRNKEDVQ